MIPNIFNNDNVNFFSSIFSYFSTEFKKTYKLFDYNDITFNAQRVYLNNMQSLKKALQ